MRKRSLLVLAVVAAIPIGALLFLRAYQLELIHAIVVNAVVQKAPEGYPQETIRQTFNQMLEQSTAHSEQSLYLQKLLKLSQRLEKIQHLSQEEMDALLEEFSDAVDPPSQGREGAPRAVIPPPGR